MRLAKPQLEAAGISPRQQGGASAPSAGASCSTGCLWSQGDSRSGLLDTQLGHGCLIMARVPLYMYTFSYPGNHSLPPSYLRLEFPS